MQRIQMGQVEHIANNNTLMQMGSTNNGINGSVLQTVPNNHMGEVAGSPGVLFQQIPVTNNPTQVLEPSSNNHVSPRLSTSKMQMAQMEPHSYNLDLLQGQFLLPNRQFGGNAAISNNVGSESVLAKRKSPGDPASNSGTQKLSMPNKRVAQMEHRPWLQQTSAPGKLPVQSQSLPNHSGSQRSQPPAKRSALGKTGQQLPNQRNQALQISPKGQSESFESVRSKLRQSLADALALVTQQQDSTSGGKTNAPEEAACIPGKTLDTSQHPGQTSVAADAAEHMSEHSRELSTTQRDSAVQNLGNCETSSQGTLTNLSTDGLNSNGLGSQSGTILHGEDVPFSDSFFAKDELLQGNGLAWVLEPDMEVPEKMVLETSEKQTGLDDVGAGQVVHDPQTLATKIEAELFKLFGGVNKKYKEKGRSLLFNLKDRNNPALRERVMAGEIPPERLCSMSAEELASEELSQWRMAKAEELAQMVVLPESDVDIRRLVKKTHKGEFQVEVDEPDSVSVDVAISAKSQTQMRPRSEEKQGSLPLKHDKMKQKVNVTADKSNSEEQPDPCTLTIPSNEGNDLMQGLMVDDELKDAEFLPPIVSLDEFMESLNSEPPFEDLPADARKTPNSDSDDSGKTASNSEKGDSPVGSESKFFGDNANAAADNPENADLAKTDKPDSDAKHSVNRKESDTARPATVSKENYIWEGLLQLNVSATAPVIGVFKSGERTSSKEWSSFIEVKGRVRLDAFEKFLQELPMSRSRSLMAVHFICNEGAAESEHASIVEAADSYVLDGRVGFAEPAPGVELYLCPPHSKTREMITKVLPKDQVDEFNAIDKGLIGVIVWRKPQIASTVSPNSASQHKHSSKKQQFTTRRYHEQDTNVKLNATQNHPSARGGPLPSYSNPKSDDNDDDDVPPGFGPPAARDEDDLPEFNFSSRSSVKLGSQSSLQNRSRAMGNPYSPHSQNQSRPVDQMRELVQKYGQSKPVVPPVNWQRSTVPSMKSWDDDDDDMPEWQPEDTRQHPNFHSMNVRGVQQQLVRANMGQQNPHQVAPPAASIQPQANGMYGQQASSYGTWMVPPGYRPGAQLYGSPATGAAGQHGMAWRRDAPQSRGF
ncbi:hypothetical protein Tsubulata_034739 [Turnera subulata]|uniref:TFIIS central domain-containing protein n=1 Tax=Turnera subulata TaxID=218843 RepID=A0A9Q0JMD3_9ROSI|nr:hypothetical protein Tsubulata_034739 [Turnera subulata]